MAWPDVYVEVAFGGVPGSALSTYTWSDITTRVELINVQMPSRSRYIDRFQPGSLTVQVDNFDRSFDPWLGSPPVFSGLFRPNLPIRVRVNYSATNYYLFTGYIDAIGISWQDPAASTATITATDAFRVIQGRNPSDTAFGAARTDQRLGALLDAADWPAADRNIGEGLSAMAAVTVDDNADVLDLLQVVSDHERGLLYMAGNGQVFFRNRSFPIASISGAFAFSDATSNDYIEVSAEANADLIYNDVTTGNTGGATFNATAPSSASTYGGRKWVKTDYTYDTDAQAQSIGEFVRDMSANYRRRFSALEFSAITNDTLWTPTLAYYPGLATSITRTPPGGGSAITRTCVIDGISHQITPLGSSAQGNWVTTWQLSDLTDTDVSTTVSTWDNANWDSGLWFY